ncbi:MAG: SBBP repeat-containing protein [Vicingaceae bacterium]|nr:SBBP repeat-containing protein [Vicingaceae bacterium]
MNMTFFTSNTHRYLLLLTLLTLLSTSNAQINVLWESRFTSAGLNSDSGKEIAIDNAGNVYVTGTSYTSFTNGYDILTIKYDPLGNQLWTSTFNGSGSALDEGRDIAVDKNGNVYVTGYTASTGPNYDYVTIKYDAAGAQQWASLYNGSANGFDEAYSLAIDTSGNTYVTGSADISGQGSNFVTIKYNTSGAQQWASIYNGPGNNIDAATQIKLDPMFNVYVSGHSYGSSSDLDIATIMYNNNGVQQWVSRYNGALNFFDVPQALSLDNSGNVYVAGYTYGGLATLNDYVTIKINSSGVQQWAQIFDGPLNDEDQAFDVLADANQDVYVTGRSMGSGGSAENMVTIKYNSMGNILWQDTYDGPTSGYDDAQQMRLGISGALYVTGYSAGIGTNNDYLTLKYDTSNGGINWEARFDGPASNSDQAFAMEIDAAESIYVTGTSTDPASFKDYSTIKWCQLETNGGNDVEICVGNSTTLNASAPGAISYLWSPASGLSNVNIANPIANPTTTTTYTVAATNGLGCIDYDTVVVTVNPLPSNNITASGPTTFCIGDSVILTADSAAIYFWSPTNSTTQSTTADSSGIYIVSVTDSNNCNNTGQITITANPVPNVSAGPDASLCNGSSMMLNATGALNYTWNTQIDLSDSTIANPIIDPTSPTTFWVIGENASGCTAIDSVFIAISISPTAVIDDPVPNDTLYLLQVNGGDIQFFGNLSTNAINYAWKFGDGGNDNVQNPIYTYTTPGFMNVELITTNGACMDTAYINVMVYNTTSISETPNSKLLNAYPNPAKDFIMLSGIFDGGFVELINYSGKIVKSININHLKEYRMDVSDVAEGVYFVRYYSDNISEFKKIIITR